MAREFYRILPDNRRGGWNLVSERDDGSGQHFQDKEEAIRIGKRLARSADVDLYVYDYDERGAHIDWEIDRSEQGVAVNIWEEDSPLPAEVQKAREQHGIPGIPQGQIQPKGKKRD